MSEEISDSGRFARKKLLKAQAMNKTIGTLVRAIDLSLEYYEDQGGTVEEEGNWVARQAAAFLAWHLFGEQQVIFMTDSSRMKIPRKLSDSSALEIRQFLSGEA